MRKIAGFLAVVFILINVSLAALALPAGKVPGVPYSAPRYDKFDCPKSNQHSPYRSDADAERTQTYCTYEDNNYHKAGTIDYSQCIHCGKELVDDHYSYEPHVVYSVEYTPSVNRITCALCDGVYTVKHTHVWQVKGQTIQGNYVRYEYKCRTCRSIKTELRRY